MTRLKRSFVWDLLPAALILQLLACTANPPAQQGSKGNASVPVNVLAGFERRASTSQDPVGVWMEALESQQPLVVQTAVARVRDSRDPRALKSLKGVAERWSSKDSHDGPQIGQLADYAAEKVEADILWRARPVRGTTDDERIESGLALLKNSPENSILRDYVRRDLLECDDPKVVWFLVTDTKQISKDRIKQLGNRAVPALLELAANRSDIFVRCSAIENLGLLRAKPSVGPMVRMLREIKAADLQGEKWRSNESRLRTALVWALAHFSEDILEQLAPEVKAADPLVRSSFFSVIGQIGGQRALAILKEARRVEPSRDTSDNVNVLETIEFHIERIEKGSQ